jgi:hypothetical protein
MVGYLHHSLVDRLRQHMHLANLRHIYNGSANPCNVLRKTVCFLVG